MPLVRKLGQFAELTGVERDALQGLGSHPRHARAHQELRARGGAAGTVILLHDGWAIRHRTLRDGRRQIIDFVVPGDLCDPSSFVGGQRDFTVSAIMPVVYTLLQPREFLDLLSVSPRLGAFLWWLESREAFFLRAHLVAIGRMRAEERLAYLIWELWTRLRFNGMALDHTFILPATQDMLADATGLSHVHVSRTLKRLEHRGVIQRTEHLYRIIDADGLVAIAQVDESLYSNELPPFVRALLGRQ